MERGRGGGGGRERQRQRVGELEFKIFGDLSILSKSQRKH